MNILVTGGTGYVGSIVTEQLLSRGYGVIVLDNLQQGHKQALTPGATFVRADLRDKKCVEDTFRNFQIDGVMHMAAETVIEYSMTDPKRYFDCNVTGGMNILNAMLRYNVNKIIFSSTAAVYGTPQDSLCREYDPKMPINSYGESKLMFEHILQWYGNAYGLKHISLRYFNASGASEQLGEDHQPETHLIPNILKVALGQDTYVPIFGGDYETQDGSCIRDYVHVIDIAHAHILALEHLDNSAQGKAYNLGNSRGYSVVEVVEAARRVTGIDIPAEVSQRRNGDPAVLVASSDLARSELGWVPEHSDLATIIQSAWTWHREHPGGYGIG